jgi:hypothetical protein
LAGNWEESRLDQFGVIKHGSARMIEANSEVYDAMVAVWNIGVDIGNADDDPSARKALEKAFEQLSDTCHSRLLREFPDFLKLPDQKS